LKKERYSQKAVLGKRRIQLSKARKPKKKNESPAHGRRFRAQAKTEAILGERKAGK